MNNHSALTEYVFYPTWKQVMEHFKDYDKRIIEHQVHVQRSAGGLEAKAIVTIHPKLAFIQLEAPGDISGASSSEKMVFATKVLLWVDDLVKRAKLKAGIDLSRTRCIWSDSSAAYCERRVMP
jgi:hypothetical protein